MKRKSDKAESSRKPRKVVMRKYDPKYIKYEFMGAGNDFKPKAQCVERAQILSNEALKPSKLQRHLESKHIKIEDKHKEYFERKGKGLQRQQKILTSFTS